MGFSVLIRTEFLKLRRSRTVTVGVVSLLAFVLLVLWGFHSYAAQRLGGVSIFGTSSGEPGYFNGLLFALYSLYFAFNFIMPVVIAVVAGAQISGEASAGTLRAILSRPVDRTSLLLSKFAVTAMYAWMVITGFVIFNLVLGFALVGWGDLALYPGPLGLVEEPGSIPLRDALGRFALATLSGTWSLMTLAAIAFFLSVVTRSPVVSVTGAILAYMVLTVVGRVEFFTEIKSHFFTTDMDFWRIVFKPEIPWREIAYGASRCGVYIFTLLLVSAVLFERKDITT
ncbi:MAG: ABC transporter permease [Deltaproteobacteria bacterium]|nr:ABC transporter permease [Deltaproteobacteria bacterium]